MARGHSYLWTPSLVVMELASNALIAVAAAAIAVALLRAGARASAPRGRYGYTLLALLAIGLCAVHALDVWVIWTPIYGIDVVARGATAIVAVAAAVVLPRMLRRS